MPAVSKAATPGPLTRVSSSAATMRRSIPGVWNRGLGLSLDTIGAPGAMEHREGHAPYGRILKIRETVVRSRGYVGAGNGRAPGPPLANGGTETAQCVPL